MGIRVIMIISVARVTRVITVTRVTMGMGLLVSVGLSVWGY